MGCFSIHLGLASMCDLSCRAAIFRSEPAQFLSVMRCLRWWVGVAQQGRSKRERDPAVATAMGPGGLQARWCSLAGTVCWPSKQLRSLMVRWGFRSLTGAPAVLQILPGPPPPPNPTLHVLDLPYPCRTQPQTHNRDFNQPLFCSTAAVFCLQWHDKACCSPSRSPTVLPDVLLAFCPL